jgi:DNA-binding PucR family transcriptional regulator
MQALMRHEAATKAKKAQEAEERGLAKVRESEQQVRQRRIEKERRDEADAQYRAAIEGKKRRDAEGNRLLILRENELAEQQRVARLNLLEQRQFLAR